VKLGFRKLINEWFNKNLHGEGARFIPDELIPEVLPPETGGTMKFSILSSDLQRALARLGGVVPSRSAMPILEHILIDVSRDESGVNTLKLTATDLEITASVSLPLTGDGSIELGKIAAPARRLSDTVRALPDIPLSFSADLATNKIVILTESGEYQLTGELSEEFPAPAEFRTGDKPVQFSIESNVLRGLAAKTSFAVSTDELRPAMLGVLLQLRSNEVRAVATDGHRLVKVVRTGIGAGTDRDVIIPSKALNLLLHGTESAPGKGERKETTGVSIGQSHIRFDMGPSVLISRLIEENYPNYESVIPLDNTKRLIVSRAGILASVRRVALYASSITRQIRLQIAPQGAPLLQVSAEDVDFGGGARETLQCEYEGEPLEIGFNARYVEDLLNHLESDRVVFQLSTPTRAAVVKPHVAAAPQEDEADRAGSEDILMLVMPIRLNS